MSTTTVQITDITYSSLSSLKSSNNLVRGHYLISNKADSGILVTVLDTNTIASEAIGLFLNCDYQDVGDYSGLITYTGFPKGTNRKVWYFPNQSSYLDGDIVFYNGKQYQLTDRTLVSNDNPSINIFAYTELLRNTTLGYIEEADKITYNFDTDTIISRCDKRNNIVYGVDGIDISNFQWGNDDVAGNFIFENSVMECANNRGIIKYNKVLSGTVIINNQNVSEVSINEFNIINYVTCNFNTTKGLKKCKIRCEDKIITFDPTEFYQGYTIEGDFSNFPAKLLMGSIYTAGVITIPSNLNYIGRFTLDGSSVTTNSIVNLPTNINVQFTCLNGQSQIFSSSNVGSASNNKIVSESLSNVTIVGRTNGSDYIQFMKSGTLNKTTAIVKLV